MKAFTFVRPTTLEEAAKAAAEKGSVIKAGGIDLLDRMKERIDEPDRVVGLVDVRDPSLTRIEEIDSARGRDLRIGGQVTLAHIAESDLVRRVAPALAEAAGLAASPQIRQRATIAGNLIQHTRCGYYRHRSFPCFKRGDDHCPVLVDGAVQDTAAIFGNGLCASAHPSSLAPVLSAYGALLKVVAEGTGETEAKVKVGEAAKTDMFPAFYMLSPSRGRVSDVRLPEGGVVTHVTISPTDGVSVYEEVRQKTAFDWALVSCCISLHTEGDRSRAHWYGADIWLGSVAPVPWRCQAAEDLIKHKHLTDESIAAAAEAAVAGATPLPGNAYKVDLVKVVVRRALERLRAMK